MSCVPDSHDAWHFVKCRASDESDELLEFLESGGPPVSNTPTLLLARPSGKFYCQRLTRNGALTLGELRPIPQGYPAADAAPLAGVFAVSSPPQSTLIRTTSTRIHS